MTTISLFANDQLLTAVLKPKIASGDMNSVLLRVDFDPIWDRFTKSAVFFTAKNDTVYEMILTDGECTVPHEVLSKSGTLFIGVRGVAADNAVKTSTLVKYKVDDGAPVGDGTTVDPTPNVYQQILERLNNLEQGTVFDEQISVAVKSYLEENPVECDAVKTINGVAPDENGNIEVAGGSGLYILADGETIADAPADVNVVIDPNGKETGGSYILTEADKQEIAEQAAELVEIPDADLTGYATEEYVRNKIAEAELGGEEVDLSGYAQKSELPTKVSQLQNDAGYLTEHQDISGKLDASALPTAINTALAQAEASGAFKGDPGEPGQKGEQGIQGIPGEKGEKGEKGDTGAPGADGAKGDKGDKGDTGANGKDGTSATHSWNGTVLTVTSASGTSSADLKGAKGDKGDKGDSIKGDKGDTGSTGATGQRGTGLLSVTTAPSSYTTAVGGITPKYRMAISTIKSQAGVTEVLLGDTVRYSYYHYPIDYMDASYAYFTERVSIRGATGAAGKDYSFDPTVYGLPVLELTGDTTGMTKETEVTLSYECNDKDGTAKTGSCTMKWQGSSSLAWDKKNYTIKFDNAFEVVDGWGSQKKYCLKANWIDHSHSRNVVSAKLWGLIRKNRSNLNSKLKALPNAGAIDGFPVIIMLNGEFHGLYSWNIPKDAWMFGMGSGTKEAIVGADNQADDTAFKAETLLDADGWELEYNSSSFTADAVKTSLNNLIKACIDSWGGDLDTTVAQYLDWESAIDYYIFAVILQGGDMITKNTILATFDGVKWYFSAYDMDTTYGLEFDGSKLNRAVTTSHTTFETIAETHRVFELIKRFKTNELKARYKALRADALSESRICNYFENYAWDISSPILVEEVKKWPSVRGSAVNGIDQICRWVRQRLEVTDVWMDALPAQETPVEPEKPVEMVNQVPISTDTDGSVYNGTGYKDNVRLSSSGGVSGTAQNGSTTTGFIPFTPGSTIRLKGAEFLDNYNKYGGHYYINFYDTNKNFKLSAGEGDVATNVGSCFDANSDEETGIITIKLLKGVNSDYGQKIDASSFFRINAYGKGADLIITVNQEIT